MIDVRLIKSINFRIQGFSPYASYVLPVIKIPLTPSNSSTEGSFPPSSSTIYRISTSTPRGGSCSFPAFTKCRSKISPRVPFSFWSSGWGSSTSSTIILTIGSSADGIFWSTLLLRKYREDVESNVRAEESARRRSDSTGTKDPNYWNRQDNQMTSPKMIAPIRDDHYCSILHYRYVEEAREASRLP